MPSDLHHIRFGEVLLNIIKVLWNRAVWERSLMANSHQLGAVRVSPADRRHYQAIAGLSLTQSMVWSWNALGEVFFALGLMAWRARLRSWHRRANTVSV